MPYMVTVNIECELRWMYRDHFGDFKQELRRTNSECDHPTNSLSSKWSICQIYASPV